MSNNVSKALEESYDILLKFEQKMNDIDRGILDTAKKVRTLNTSGGSSPSPKDVSATIKKNKQFTEQLNAELKEQERAEKALIKQLAKKAISLESIGKAQAKQRVEQQIINKVNKEDAILTSKLTTEKQKAVAELTKLNREYDNLAIRQERYGDLTEDQIKEMARLKNESLKLNNVLKKTEKTTGRFGRDVGNYKSGFDGLGFSIAQITREAPAFANSMQTGFLAISNNIPMLVDEINRLKLANVELASSGKPIVSVGRQIVKSLFSWQTAISAGITLLTVFGPKLIDWARGEKQAEKATEDATEALESQNDELKKNLALRQQILNLAQGELQSGSFVAAFEDILKNLSESADTELVLIELSERLKKKNIEGSDVLRDQNLHQAERIIFAKNLLKIEQLKIDLENERLRLEELNSSEVKKQIAIRNGESAGLSDILKIQGEIQKLQNQNNFIAKNKVEIIKTGNDQSKEEITILKDTIGFYEQKIGSLEEERKNRSTTKKEYDDYTVKILDATDALEKLKKALINVQQEEMTLVQAFDNVEDPSPTDEEIAEQYQKDIKAYQEYVREKERLGNQLKQHQQELYNSIKQFATESIDVITQRELDKYDERIEANSNFYDGLLENEDLTEKQRLAIEEERDKKEKELEKKKERIERRAFVLKQLAALAEIAINTAQSVAQIKAQAAVLAANPITKLLVPQALAQIPLVIDSGSIAGATILGTTIAQFKEGHLDGIYEGVAMINDAPGSNYREIVERKNGFLEMYQGRNQLINMEKGDRVHKAGTFEPSNILQNGLALSAIQQEKTIASMQIDHKPSKINSEEVGKIVGEYVSKAVKNMPRPKGINYGKLAKAIIIEQEVRNR